jgi:hypothetical protein
MDSCPSKISCQRQHSSRAVVSVVGIFAVAGGGDFLALVLVDCSPSAEVSLKVSVHIDKVIAVSRTAATSVRTCVDLPVTIDHE